LLCLGVGSVLPIVPLSAPGPASLPDNGDAYGLDSAFGSYVKRSLV